MAKDSYPLYPLKVSENKRYFVDQKDRPVFWLGDTQWELFRGFSLEDARYIIRKRKSQGFSVIHIKLFGGEDGLKPNINGDFPWKNVEKLIPNEPYFVHMDKVIKIAREENMQLAIAVYHQRYRDYMTEKNMRGFSEWFSRRYRNVPGIIWSFTPKAAEEYRPVIDEIAKGLKKGDGGRHLITFKPDPSPYSSSFIHNEPWLDFNCSQTWNLVSLIYPFILIDYILEPVKPVVMAEGAYEAGSEYGFEVTPLWVRRQAYYSYLAGAGHGYGHNDCWRILPTWKKSLDAPGAWQLCALKKIFLGIREWWRLVPDQSVFASGSRISGNILNLGARHEDGLWILAYLANPDTVSVNLGKLAANDKVSATWIDPRTGRSKPAGRFSASQTPKFSTPKGWEDALLLLK